MVLGTLDGGGYRGRGGGGHGNERQCVTADVNNLWASYVGCHCSTEMYGSWEQRVAAGFVGCSRQRRQGVPLSCRLSWSTHAGVGVIPSQGRRFVVCPSESSIGTTV